MKHLTIVGVGAFCRETLPSLQGVISDSYQELLFVVDDDYLENLSLPKTSIPSTSLPLSDFLQLSVPPKEFCVPIGQVNSRARLARLLIERGLTPFSIAAKSSLTYQDSSLGPGYILCSNSIVSSQTQIGSFLQLGFGSYLAHDCVVGNYVTIGPNSTICGYVNIEDQVQIGAGVVVKPGSSNNPLIIGCGSVIGAGAVVTKSVPPGSVMVGNPARNIADCKITS